MVLPLLLCPTIERCIFLLELPGRDGRKAQWPRFGPALRALQAAALYPPQRKLRSIALTFPAIFEEPIIAPQKPDWLLPWPLRRRSLWICQGPWSRFAHSVPQPLNSTFSLIFRSLKFMTLPLRKSNRMTYPETSSTKPGSMNTIKNPLKSQSSPPYKSSNPLSATLKSRKFNSSMKWSGPTTANLLRTAKTSLECPLSKWNSIKPVSMMTKEHWNSSSKLPNLKTKTSNSETISITGTLSNTQAESKLS